MEKLERQAKRVQNEKMRQAHVKAVNQCRQWLRLTWAEMLTPVDAQMKRLTTQAQPLLDKEKQKQPMTEQEQQQLQEMHAVYAVYNAFRQKISPTAHRASVERHVREQERGRGK